MSVTLVLLPRNRAVLRGLLSSRHAPLRPSQFRARFGPSVKTVKAVRTWAKAHRLRVTSVSSNRVLVHLRGSSTALGRALRTHFARYSAPGSGRFTQITRSARLPRAFSSRVSAVLGLSSLGHVFLRPPARRSAVAQQTELSMAKSALPALPTLPSPSTLMYPNQYGPQDFWKMYDAPSTQTGSGQKLAIITEGDVSQPKKDLSTFEAKFGLPAVTWNQINVGAPTSDTSGSDEWDLDSQYSTGLAPGVTQLNVYVGRSLSDQDIVSTINRWVTDNLSKQGSFSAGECELLAYAAGFTGGLDTVLAQADAQGQTMFFSSGDTGTQCPAIVGVNGVPAGVPGVNYPASSPYGIGVGGTTVLSPSGPFEIAWYAGGGGSSYVEPTPAYQSTTTYGAAPLVRRGVPDVSLDADPESGYRVIVSGTEQVIGGTSASAPAWQGIWARAQGARSGALGFAGPVIYNTEPATAYHDITLGSNGFPATPGWDYATGRGTPDIAKFVSGS
ncbi:MAG: S53 family peptidase [Actinomycetota bacterium]|nr:S53 family peptidase [Actinomycetota bacterium]